MKVQRSDLSAESSALDLLKNFSPLCSVESNSSHFPIYKEILKDTT